MVRGGSLRTRIATADDARLAGTNGVKIRDVRARATERSNPNALRMPPEKRRVDISFDLERDALRAVASAFSRVRRPSQSAGDVSSDVPRSSARQLGVEAAGNADEDRDAIEATTARELERFAHELAGRGRAAAPRTPDRRADLRHGLTRPTPADTGVAPHPGRRASDRQGSAWEPLADRRAVAPPPIAPTVAARAPTAVTPAAAPPAVAPPAAAAVPDAARYLAALVAAYGPLEPIDATVSGTPLPDLLVIDASALPALARGNVRARAHLSHAVGALARVVVPATALLDAAHARVAHAIAEIGAVDVVLAKTAARLIADTGLRSESTALAVASASRSAHGAVLTGDVATAQRYARALGRPGLVILPI